MTTPECKVVSYSDLKSLYIDNDWEVSNPKFESHINILRKYLDKDHQYNISEYEVETAFRIVDYAIRYFPTLSELNQTVFTDFAVILSSIKDSFPPNSDYHAKVFRAIRIYLDNDLIGDALTRISYFLTPARIAHPMTEKEYSIAIKVCAFAIDFYNELSPKVQKDIIELNHIFNLTNREELQKHPYFINLKKIFDKVPANNNNFQVIDLTEPVKVSQPSIVVAEDDGITKLGRALKRLRKVTVSTLPDIPENTFYETLCEITKSQEETLSKEDIERREFLNKNLIKAQSFCIRVASQYHSQNFFSKMHTLAILFNDKFSLLFPKISNQMFMKQPRSISPLEKHVIISTLKGLGLFLHDYSECWGTEPLIRNLFGRIAKMEGNNEYIGIEKLHLKIHKKIEGLVEFFSFEPSELNTPHSYRDEMYLLILTSHIQEMLNRLIRPDTIVFILDRLLTDYQCQLSRPSKSPPPDAYPALDNDFSYELGTVISELCTEFLKFGQAHGLFSLLGKGIIMYINNHKLEIGKFLQQRLSYLTSSECLIEPIKILDVILFEQTEPYRPTVPAFFNKTKEEHAVFARNLYSRIQDQFIPSLMKKIEAIHYATPLALKRESTKNFCQLITDKLWALSQNEELTLALAFYLLSGVEKSLKAETTRLANDRHCRGVSSTTSQMVARTK